MSASASRLQLEKPRNCGSTPLDNFVTTDPTEASEADEQHEREVLEKFAGITSPTSSSIIAVDLDDVLSETNQGVADCEVPGYPNTCPHLFV